MERLGSRVAVPARLMVGMLALGAGLGALAVAQGPGRSITYAGSSHAAAALTLIAGFGLAATGLAMSWNRRTRRIGSLALAAGVTWFAAVWVAWSDGPPLVRSVAMVATGLTFPFVVHLVLVYPGGRASTVPVRAFVGVVYLEAVLAAVALALFRDPYFDPSCWANCTVNSFLIRSIPSLAQSVELADRWLVLSAALTLIAICLIRLAASQPPSRRRLMPVFVPAIAFAAAVAARAIALQSTSVEDPFNTILFTIFVIGSTAMTLLAGGLLWLVGRRRAVRAAIDRVVANLDQAPRAGTLQSALAHALHDPQLRISYRLSDPERYVDASGQPVSTSTATRGRTVTRLTRKGRTIAVIVHAGDGPELETQLGPAVRLGLENERLQAQTLAQLEELQASRTRIVDTADHERRRLERDLHDGAQQHLLALSYEIRFAHTSAQANADRPTQTTLARAIEHTSAALDELRELAHGIHPAVLTEAGLGPAVQTLADAAPVAVEVHAPRRRYPTPVETIAYFAIAEAVDDAAHRHADHVAVTVDQIDERLLVIVEDDGPDRRSPIAGLADRVAAHGGTLSTTPTACRLEIPCA